MPSAALLATAERCVFCLVRHGETGWNRVRRLQGHEDIPLNANGMVQAERLGLALADVSFDAIYSSDLRRALATAEAVARRQGARVEPLAALRERHYGIFQGYTREESAARHPAMQARLNARDPEFVPPGGESLRQCFERVSALLEALAVRHRGQRVLLVAHGGVLDAARRLVTGQALDAPRDFLLGNAALNWISQAKGQWYLHDWNDTQHLTDSRDELDV